MAGKRKQKRKRILFYFDQEQLLSCRTDKNQQTAAEELGISPTLLSKAERGIGIENDGSLKIAKGYGIKRCQHPIDSSTDKPRQHQSSQTTGSQIPGGTDQSPAGIAESDEVTQPGEKDPRSSTGRKGEKTEQDLVRPKKQFRKKEPKERQNAREAKAQKSTPKKKIKRRIAFVAVVTSIVGVLLFVLHFNTEGQGGENSTSKVAKQKNMEKVVVLFESTAWADDDLMVKIKREIRKLEKKISSASNCQIGHIKTLKCRRQYKLSIKLVENIDGNLMEKENALLGFGGKMKIEGEIRNATLRFGDAIVWFNLKALALFGEGLDNRGVPIKVEYNRQKRNGDSNSQIINKEFVYPFLLNSIFGTCKDNNPKQLKFTKRHAKMMECTISINDEPAPVQNLNLSARNEFAFLSTPFCQDSPIVPLRKKQLSIGEIEKILTGSIILKTEVENYVSFSQEGYQIDADSSWDTFGDGPLLKNYPKFLQAIEMHLLADTRLLAIQKLYSKKHRYNLDYKKIKKRIDEAFEKTLSEAYVKTAELKQWNSAIAYITAAQIYRQTPHGVEKAIKILRKALKIEDMDRTAQMSIKYAIYKLRAARISGIPDGAIRQNDIKEIKLILSEMEESWLKPLAYFEKARIASASVIKKTGLSADKTFLYSVEASFRMVLQLTPKHLLSRFLLAKMLDDSCSGENDNWNAKSKTNPEAESILKSIIQDLTAIKERYDPDLHSLSDHDFVHHSVDPTYVLEDLLAITVAQCDIKKTMQAIKSVRKLTIDWKRIRRVLNMSYGAGFYFLFPKVKYISRSVTIFPNVCRKYRESQLRSLEILPKCNSSTQSCWF